MNPYIIAGIFAFGILVGWRGEVWHQAYQDKKIEDKAIVKLGEGETKIIDFNQDFDKESVLAVDKCFNSPIPAGMLGLLQQHK